MGWKVLFLFFCVCFGCKNGFFGWGIFEICWGLDCLVRDCFFLFFVWVCLEVFWIGEFLSVGGLVNVLKLYWVWKGCWGGRMVVWVSFVLLVDMGIGGKLFEVRVLFCGIEVKGNVGLVLIKLICFWVVFVIVGVVLLVVIFGWLLRELIFCCFLIIFCRYFFCVLICSCRCCCI